MSQKSSLTVLSFLLVARLASILSAQDLTLANYTENDTVFQVPGSFAGPFGTGSIEIELSPPDRPGNQALKLMDYHSNLDGSWGIIHIKEFDVDQDISGFQLLQFSFYSEGDDSTPTVAI